MHTSLQQSMRSVNKEKKLSVSFSGVQHAVYIFP